LEVQVENGTFSIVALQLTLGGDVNKDGVIDLRDLVRVRNQMESEGE